MPTGGPLTYGILLAAIIAEVSATLALKSTEGFTRLLPLVIVAIGYGLAFWLLSLCLERLPIGVVYATWAGLGMIGTTIAGNLLHGEAINGATMLGVALITSGVVVMATYGGAAGSGPA